MKKSHLLDVAKYLLAAGLLAWVVYANWSPPPTKAVAALGASTVGLSASPGGPLLAAASATPGRADSRGLGYVWKRHVVEGHPVQVGYLALGFAAYLLAIFLTLVRWQLLVKALDLTLSFRDAMRYGLVGIFFNTFLPGSVGGDVVKAAALARTQNRRTAAVATVIMDRVIALWALVWFVAILGGVFWAAGLLTGPASAVASTIVLLAAAIVAVSASIWLAMGLLSDRRAERFAGRLARLPLAGHAAAEMWRSVWMYRKRQKAVAWVMALTWVGQVGFVVSFWCCACALWTPELGAVPSLTQHFLLVPIGLTMQALVPTPGGAGGGEWGFAALYVLFRASEANGVLASLMQRVMSWVVGVAGYALALGLAPATPEPAAAPVTLPVPAREPTALAG
ncbi:MAG: lysylphosphatidylglycerol synthase transmembrane domain-containing protein [Gemmataceae bacterium]